MEWISIGKLGDLESKSKHLVRVRGLEIAVIRNAEGFFAVDNICPHAGGSLVEGSVEGRILTCSSHSYQFDCQSGQCLTDSRHSLRAFEIKVEDGELWVRVPRATQNAPQEISAPKEKSSVEVWKSAKHGFEVWPDILRHAHEKTSMSKMDLPDLERMKWYGFFYRKNNDPDHYMCRIRIPGCELTKAQACAIAYIAYESGYSIVDLTTRGNIQIQGLTIDKLPRVHAALGKVGLTSRQSGHDNVRNITSHPMSGIDPEELIDTRELSRQIQAMIIGSREFSDLPRKMNIALCGRPSGAIHLWTQDISYVATWGPKGSFASPAAPGGVEKESLPVGFQLLLGGNQGSSVKLATPMPVFVRPEQILDVTAAILKVYRELGDRSNRHQVRFRFLMERLGPDLLLQEIEKRLGYELERFPKPPTPPSSEENFIGWFKQKQQDLWTVGVCVPVGRLTWDQLEGLAVVAQKYGSGTLRTTQDQNILIPGIPSNSRSAVEHAIAGHRLTFEPDSVARNVVSCTGKQFCNLAITETKGHAYQLMEALRRRNVQLHRIGIRMSGCPSSCAMSHTADIGLKGSKTRRRLRLVDAFDVYLAGGVGEDIQTGQLYKKGVPTDQLPDLIDTVVSEYYLRRNGEETFSQYWRKKLQTHKTEVENGEVPKWCCSRCGHSHVAQDPPPYCPVCAALRAQFKSVPENE